MKRKNVLKKLAIILILFAFSANYYAEIFSNCDCCDFHFITKTSNCCSLKTKEQKEIKEKKCCSSQLENEQMQTGNCANYQIKQVHDCDNCKFTAQKDNFAEIRNRIQQRNLHCRYFSSLIDNQEDTTILKVFCLPFEKQSHFYKSYLAISKLKDRAPPILFV